VKRTERKARRKTRRRKWRKGK